MIVYINLLLALLALIALIVFRQKFKKLSITAWKQSLILISGLLLIAILNILSIGILSNSRNASNRDIIFLVDLTKSMNAIDGRNGGENTRFDNAREDIINIVDDNPGVSFAIHGFNFSNKFISPLTTNKQDVEEAIDTTQTADYSNTIPGTIKYSDALGKLNEYLKKQHELDPTRERIVVILSDFEIYKNQESNEEVAQKAKELRQYAGGFVNIVYGKEEGSKILNMTFDHIDGKYKPLYKVFENTTTLKYASDPENKYSEVISKPNLELAKLVTEETGGNMIRYNEADQYNKTIDKASRSANQKAIANPKSQSVKQNWLYAPIALILFIWIVLSEILKPKWLGQILNNKRVKK